MTTTAIDCYMTTVNRGAQIIERERVVRGWSNQQLAAEIETDEGMTSRLRRGKTKPNRELSVRIRDRFGIDPALWDEEVAETEPPPVAAADEKGAA